MGLDCGHAGTGSGNQDSNTKEKAQLENLTVPNEVIVFIADKIASNIRELKVP